MRLGFIGRSTMQTVFYCSPVVANIPLYDARFGGEILQTLGRALPLETERETGKETGREAGRGLDETKSQRVNRMNIHLRNLPRCRDTIIQAYLCLILLPILTHYSLVPASLHHNTPCPPNSPLLASVNSYRPVSYNPHSLPTPLASTARRP
jgi:hypothetical protein